MKVIETLTSTYPIPSAVLQRIALIREVDLDAQATSEILTSKGYNLAYADIKRWLSTAPDISQSGISFNLTDKVRESLRKGANAIYKEYGDPKFNGVVFGFKGNRL